MQTTLLCPFFFNVDKTSMSETVPMPMGEDSDCKGSTMLQANSIQFLHIWALTPNIKYSHKNTAHAIQQQNKINNKNNIHRCSKISSKALIKCHLISSVTVWINQYKIPLFFPTVVSLSNSASSIESNKLTLISIKKNNNTNISIIHYTCITFTCSHQICSKTY